MSQEYCTCSSVKIIVFFKLIFLIKIQKKEPKTRKIIVAVLRRHPFVYGIERTTWPIINQAILASITTNMIIYTYIF